MPSNLRKAGMWAAMSPEGGPSWPPAQLPSLSGTPLVSAATCVPDEDTQPWYLPVATLCWTRFGAFQDEACRPKELLSGRGIDPQGFVSLRFGF